VCRRRKTKYVQKCMVIGKGRQYETTSISSEGLPGRGVSYLQKKNHREIVGAVSIKGKIYQSRDYALIYEVLQHLRQMRRGTTTK